MVRREYHYLLQLHGRKAFVFPENELMVFLWTLTNIIIIMLTYTKRMHKLSKRGRKQSSGANRRTLRLCDDHWNNDNIVDRFLYE